ESSRKALFKMRIFNPDGSEPDMCGNGARCTALWAHSILPSLKGQYIFETKAGILAAEVADGKPLSIQPPHSAEVRLKMTNPTQLRLGLSLTVFKRTLH
ncbi:MAG: hypothetical protein JSW40_05185, partial [Candidatus Omnitrophota bacterium]